MGNLGGGLGTLLGSTRDLSDRRRAISAFCGMAGAMGSLLPSPVLAVLLMHELTVTSRPCDTRFNAAVPDAPHGPYSPFDDGDGAGSPLPAVDQHDFMEQVTLGGVAATAGYTVFTSLAPHTWLSPSSLPFPASLFSQYETWHNLAAVPLGIAAGLLGVITLILLGVFRKVAKRVTSRLLDLGLSPRAAAVLLPGIGGVLFGLVGVAFPLTLGDGAMQVRGRGKEGGNGMRTAVSIVFFVSLWPLICFSFFSSCFLSDLFPLLPSAPFPPSFSACFHSISSPLVSSLPINLRPFSVSCRSPPSSGTASLVTSPSLPSWKTPGTAYGTTSRKGTSSFLPTTPLIRTTSSRTTSTPTSAWVRSSGRSSGSW